MVVAKTKQTRICGRAKPKTIDCLWLAGDKERGDGRRAKNVLMLLLVAFVLFGITFSSCKACDGDPIAARAKSVDGENAPAFDALDGFALSEVAKHLRQRGASNAEIKAMVNIGRGGFGEGIGHIVHSGGHFNYRDTNGTPYEGQTQLNCGLYAMKRLLFVLGRCDIVDKNLWYEHTDQELRDELAAMPKGEIYKEQDRMIDAGYLMRLMMDIGVPVEYRKIYDCNGKEIKTIMALGAPALTMEELAMLTEKVHKEISALRERKEQIVALSMIAEAKVKAQMRTVEDSEADKHVRDNAAQEAINAADEAEQAATQAEEVREEANNGVILSVNVNSALGGWEIPPDLMQFVNVADREFGSAVTSTRTSADETAKAVAGSRLRLN